MVLAEELVKDQDYQVASVDRGRFEGLVLGDSQKNAKSVNVVVD